MSANALTTRLSAVLLAAGLIFTASVQPTLAGPEAISSKDKNPIVEVPTECNPRWYFSFGSGTEFDGGNDFSNGLEEFTDFEGGLFFTELRVKSRSYDDIYKNWINLNAEFGYAITRHIDVFAKLNYAQADSQTLVGSELILDSPLNPFPFALAFPFTSNFDNYQSWGGELGFRFYFTSPESRIRPYISLAGGANFVDEIDLRVKTDFLTFDFEVYDGPFYDDSVVWTGSALFGVEYQVIPCRFSVGTNVGVRYNSELDSDDSGFSSDSSSEPTPMSGVGQFVHDQLGANGSSEDFESALLSLLSPLNNDGGERWSLPVSVYAKFRF